MHEEDLLEESIKKDVEDTIGYKIFYIIFGLIGISVLCIGISIVAKITFEIIKWIWLFL